MKSPTRFLALLVIVAAACSAGRAEAQNSYWDYGGSGSGGGGNKSGGLFGASELSYGYFDLGYFVHDFDAPEISDNANGFAGALSIPLVDSFYVKGMLGFANPETDDGRDVDYLAWELGAGIGLPIAGIFDLVLEGGLAYRKLEGDSLAAPIDDISYYLLPGVRIGFGGIVELFGGVKFLGVEGADDPALEAKLLLHLTPNVSLFGAATFADEVDQYGAGIRLSF